MPYMILRVGPTDPEAWSDEVCDWVPATHKQASRFRKHGTGYPTFLRLLPLGGMFTLVSVDEPATVTNAQVKAWTKSPRED